MLSNQLQQQLKKMMIFDEGKRNYIYRDNTPEQNETLGIGHLCANGFSDSVVDLIFQEDWQACVAFLSKNFDWFEFLDDVRKLAMINMRFQLGPERFIKFKATIDCMAKKDYIGASRQILASKWAKQTPERNGRIAFMILHGEFPKEYGLNA